uniref:HIT-type domain-containing protein n=1 Tax=Anopheles farauti TaxID=69004 RepID=A0A182QZ67_9DIPT
MNNLPYNMGDEVCKICGNKQARYNCPRCNILYCSVECYKSQQHLECSEGFYRENVVQELALRKADADAASSSKSMLEILQRMEQPDPTYDQDTSDGSENDPEGEDDELDSDDDAQEDELAVRMQGIDLDNAASVRERLTDTEKEEFQKLLANGDITKMLPEPSIWWTMEYKVDLIQPATDLRSEQEQRLLKACPKVWQKIPNLSELLNKEPSPTVRHNIANVLAAYSFVYRYFLGDIQENVVEAADCLLAVCLNLKKGTVFDSEAMAVESVTSECRNEQLPTDNNTTKALMTDVRVLFSGPKECGQKFKKLFLLAALSDVRNILSSASRELKQIASKDANNATDNEINIDVSDLKHVDGPLLKGCLKKLDFFLAYANSKYL